MAAMSERKAAEPRSARVDRAASRASARTRGRSAARIFWPPVWPIGPSRTTAETRWRQREHEGLQARFERQVVAGRGGGDGDRIGDALLARRLRKGSQSHAARAAATKAVPCAVVSSRRSAEAASATASAFVSISAGQSPDLRRAKGRGEQDRIGARRAEAQEIDQPAAERARIENVAGLHRPFEPMRIGERADREGRRQPQHQGQERAVGLSGCP